MTFMQKHQKQPKTKQKYQQKAQSHCDNFRQSGEEKLDSTNNK